MSLINSQKKNLEILKTSLTEYIDISFRAFSDYASPVEVSRILGRVGTKQFEKGETRKILKSGKILKYQQFGWLYEEIHPISEKHLSAHLVEIVSKLGMTEEASKNLRNAGFDLDVYVGIFNAPTTWGFSLDIDHLELFSRLAVRVGFSFY